MPAKIAAFSKLQWVMFLVLYWGLRLTGEKALSQNISFFITLILITSLGWVIVAIIGRDREVRVVSQRVMADTSVSLIVVLLSEVITILWVFVEFDGIQIAPVINYILMKHITWMIFPVLCLIWDKRMRQGVATS